jgi:signal transduction histidine kinase
VLLTSGMTIAAQAPKIAVLAEGERQRGDVPESGGAAAPGAGERWRVLLFGRDAGRVSAELAREGLSGCPCDGVRSLRREMARGAAALVLTELTAEDLSTRARSLKRVLSSQPPWSDLPVVALVSNDEPPEVRDAWLAALDTRGRVALLDRPVRSGPLVTAVRSALHARCRQYEARALCHELVRVRAEREASLLRESEANARADAAMRAKEDFLSTISHELRTPINAILGWTTMLLHGSLPSEKTRRALEIVERNARAQGLLVQELLDASEIGGGRLRLCMRPIDFAAVVRLAVETAQPAADAKEIHVASDLAPTVPMHGDPDRLLQIASQLIANAVKFTPRGGSVHVRLALSPSSVQLTVDDTGQGIAVECIPFVFDRFWQADASTTRRFGGLGLGLAIVRRLVELHGGTADVRSDRAVGATFVVTLPLASRTPQSGEAQKKDGDEACDTAGCMRGAPPA